MDLLTAVKVESLDKIKESIKRQGITRDAKWSDYKSLNVALEYGRKDVALLLLDQNCRVNKTTKSAGKNSTPLHNAVKLGDVQVVKKLLEKQASVTAIDSEKNSPLHLAFINKNDILVDLLLDNIQQTSNHVILKNNQGLSHLHIACTAKNVQCIQGFVDAGANIDDAVDGKSPYWAGFTAMHFAVEYKCLEAVSALLKLDVKPASKTSEGKTPLDIAYQSIEDLLIIIDLLKRKTSENKFNNKMEGEPSNNWLTDMIGILQKNLSEHQLKDAIDIIKKTTSDLPLNYGMDTSFTNFHIACLTESDKVVEKFIKYGANINDKTPLNFHLCSLSSPLHCAVVSKCKKKVQLLLEQGHELNCTNSEFMTPLHLALYNERLAEDESIEIIQLLYAAVEDKMLDREDIYGMSYFHVAIARNDLKTVKKYLDKDRAFVNKIISINPYQFHKYSPVHLAVEYQHPEMVELLVNYGADVNAFFDMNPPLHTAFERGDTVLIDLLLEKGAKVDLLEPLNKDTVLHSLLRHSYSKNKSRRNDQLHKNSEAILLYIEHLVKLGIDINAKNMLGNTALHHNLTGYYIAHEEDFNHDGCLQLLLDLGADINLENNHGMVPLQIIDIGANGCDSKSFLTYYHHMQKLKALGMKVHPKNEELCKKFAEKKKFEEGELASMEQQRLNEIAKLKAIKLGDATTLCDFLKLDSRRAVLYAQSKALKKIATDSELKEKYPLYGYLIRLQYNMAVKSYKNNKIIYKTNDKYDEHKVR